jgi:hypothetical protein
MDYSFADKSSEQIIRDLEAGLPQCGIGGGAYEIAGAALQAAVARENRRWAVVSAVAVSVSVVLSVVALVVSILR